MNGSTSGQGFETETNFSQNGLQADKTIRADDGNPTNQNARDGSRDYGISSLWREISCYLRQRGGIPFLVSLGGFLTTLLWPFSLDLYFLLFRDAVADKDTLDALKSFGWVILLLIIFIVLASEAIRVHTGQEIAERKSVSASAPSAGKSHIVRIGVEAFFFCSLAIAYIVLTSATSPDGMSPLPKMTVVLFVILFGIVACHIWTLARPNGEWRIERFICSPQGILSLCGITSIVSLCLASYAEVPFLVFEVDAANAPWVSLSLMAFFLIAIFELLWLEFVGVHYFGELHFSSNAKPDLADDLEVVARDPRASRTENDEHIGDFKWIIAAIVLILALFVSFFLCIIWLIHP